MVWWLMKRERKVMINHSSISRKSDMEESVMFCPELSLDPPRPPPVSSHAFTGRAGGGALYPLAVGSSSLLV